MVAYTKPQQRKNEESEMLRGEGDQIKFIDLRFERLQVLSGPCLKFFRSPKLFLISFPLVYFFC